MASAPTCTPIPSVEKAEVWADRIKATVYGQCVGDAIGLLTEFLSKREAKIYYGKNKKHLEYNLKIPDFHRSRWQEGDWTDDSDHMLLILISLVDNAGQVNLQDFAGKLKNWMLHGFSDLGDLAGMGIGQTTKAVVTPQEFTTDPQKVAYACWDNSGRDIAANGGVMRTSVVGAHCWWDVSSVADNALQLVKCTHHDPRCQASAVAVSVGISLMLQRLPRHLDKHGKYKVDLLIKDSYMFAAKCLETEEQKKLLWEFMSCCKLEQLKLAEPGKIGYTYKSMGSGFWALKQDNFRKAIQKIVMEGGDADSNACVAGAMLGCKLGLAAIPESWKTGLKHQRWLDAHIERFLSLQRDMMQKPPAASEKNNAIANKDATAQETDGSD